MSASNVLPSAPPVETQSSLYPNITSEYNDDNFRLTEISQIKKRIADETEHYRLVLKKYKKARKAIHYSAVSLGSLTTILSAGAITTSLTGIGLIASIPLATVAGLSGAFSTALTAVNKKLELKVEKHTKIHALAVAKHDTINRHVSKALTDNKFTHLEFETVSSEIENYYQLKDKLRSKFVEKNKASSPQPDPDTIRNEVREELLKKLNNLVLDSKLNLKETTQSST